MPKGAATNPGSADPSVRGQESDAQSLDADESLGRLPRRQPDPFQSRIRGARSMITAWHDEAELSARAGKPPEQAFVPGDVRLRGVLLNAAAALGAREELAALNDLHNAVLRCRGDVGAILHLARKLGISVPLPQQGRTLALWQQLATLGAAELTAARIIEPHLDALAILAQAGQETLNTAGSTWGVFAAQGPGQALTATPEGNGWRLAGDKPWCSMAESLSHALVTARIENAIQLFAVDLDNPGITSAERQWRALGLPAVPSTGLSFHNVTALPVGAPDWYLHRPGFAWGGAGVAAIWHGAATAIARRLHQHCLSRKPDQIALWQLGTVDQALWSANAAFQAAAAVADAGAGATMDAPGLQAIIVARLRATVVSAAETVLSMAAHGMGPEPLAFEAEHAQRVADLELYLRQDHAERSLAVHGAALLASAADGASAVAPW
ncbi:MAG: acyl-CoA dehydrogenase family protein [Nitrococcus sp.]|nr:acyl-CoA dehydrogenase family protein [Nitrococcus sp.]